MDPSRFSRRNLTPDAEFHSHVDQAQADDGRGYWASWAEKAMSDPAAAATVARYFRRTAEELYDVQVDPNELKNPAADPAHAAMLAELRASIDGWMKAQGDAGLATEEKFRPPVPAPAAVQPAKGGRKAVAKKADREE